VNYFTCGFQPIKYSIYFASDAQRSVGQVASQANIFIVIGNIIGLFLERRKTNVRI